MPDTKWMILRDTQKKGREIFIGMSSLTQPQHAYSESGVLRLRKLTVVPGGWGDIHSAVKVKKQIWVSFSYYKPSLDHIWYPLRPYDGAVLTADWERNEAINKEIRDRLREEGRRNVK